MSEKRVIDILRELGLSRREMDVYFFLSKKGTQGVKSVSTNLKIERVQAYRMLNNLQEKGVIEATLETPVRFAAVPLARLIDSMINTKKSELSELELGKSEMTRYWETLSASGSELPVARFLVLTERRRIYDEIRHAFQESREEILELTSSAGVIQEDLAGIFDEMVDLAPTKPDVRIKILTNITKENEQIVEKLTKRISGEKLNIQLRHIEMGSRTYPRFMIKDEEEAILYVTTRDESTFLSQMDTGLRINSRIFVSALRGSFMEMWRNSMDAESRLEELTTGKPSEETLIIKDPGEAGKKLAAALAGAGRDIVAITSSDGLDHLLRTAMLALPKDKGLKIRIMAPIDLDNLQAAQSLSEFCEVRHVQISYLLMMIVDGDQLFMFESPKLDAPGQVMPFYLEDMFYTNDSRYVIRVKEMVDDIWKRGVEIRELILGAAAKTPTILVESSDTVMKVVEEMLRNNASHVVVTEHKRPIGLISERDLIDRAIKGRADPDKTLAKEVMSTSIVTTELDQLFPRTHATMSGARIQRKAIMRDGRLVGMMRLD
ncbi:MAG TPA: helix-turn-helix domain-containing protein [Candidatus Bathyarchaeia archaeon]|nr:helix-turn-helix domain-containing protein [Candidatus Bathyarchaeia archaeon]